MAFRCPQCNTPLTNDEYSQGFCPVCKASLTGETSREYFPPADDGYDRMSSPYSEGYGDYRTSSLGSDWSGVRTGLNLLFNGNIVVLITAAVLMAVGGIMIALALAGNMGGGGGGNPEMAPAMIGLGCFACIGFIGLAVGGIMALVGFCMCCTVPKESGANGYIVGSLLLLISAVVLSFVLGLIKAAQPGNVSLITQILDIIPVVISAAGAILFALFLRSVSDYLDRPDVAKSAVFYAYFLVVNYIAQGGLIVVSILFQNQLPMNQFGQPGMFQNNPQGGANPFGNLGNDLTALYIFFSVLGVLIILGLISYIWYLTLIFKVKREVAYKMDQSKYEY